MQRKEKMDYLDKATEKVIQEVIDKVIYQRTKNKIMKECSDITYRISELENVENGFIEYSKFGMTLLSNIAYYYSSSTLEQKQQILGLMFPEKLIFENNTYRTSKPNPVLELLYAAGKDTAKTKKGQKVLKNHLSSMVAGSIEISNQLISDFIETVKVADHLIDLNLLNPIIWK